MFVFYISLNIRVDLEIPFGFHFGSLPLPKFRQSIQETSLPLCSNSHNPRGKIKVVLRLLHRTTTLGTFSFLYNEPKFWETQDFLMHNTYGAPLQPYLLCMSSIKVQKRVPLKGWKRPFTFHCSFILSLWLFDMEFLCKSCFDL